MQADRWLGVALAAGALAFAGCGDDEEEPAPAAAPSRRRRRRRRPRSSRPIRRWARSRPRARSRSASSSTCRRSASRTRRANEVEGFDVEMGKAVAAKLGVEPKFIEAISDNRIPFLEDGTADLILSTMTINEERVGADRVLGPVLHRARARARAGGLGHHGRADLAGKNVCTALGSTYEANLKTQAPEAKLKLVDSYSECLELVQNGAVDAVSTDDVILTGMIIQDDTLKLVGEQLTQEPYGAGIKKGETEMVDVRQRGLPGPQGRRHLERSSTSSGSASTPASRASRRRSPSTRPWSSSRRTPLPKRSSAQCRRSR